MNLFFPNNKINIKTYRTSNTIYRELESDNSNV